MLRESAAVLRGVLQASVASHAAERRQCCEQVLWQRRWCCEPCCERKQHVPRGGDAGEGIVGYTEHEMHYRDRAIRRLATL